MSEAAKEGILRAVRYFQANLTDIHLIEKARRQALSIYERDAELQHPAHQLLAAALDRFWGGGKGDIS